MRKFTDDEDKVRKRWVLSLLIAVFTMKSIQLISLVREKLSTVDTVDFQVIFKITIGALILVALGLVSFGVPYFFAHVKRGTKVLILIMILLPAREILQFMRMGWNEVANWDLLNWCLLAMIYGVWLFYWINCLRLYRINAICRNDRQKIVYDKRALDKARYRYDRY